MNRKNTVDYQELLKRYYEGKTTLEEENLLRTHLFSHTEESHADVTLFRILAEESQALPPDRNGTTSGSLDRPATGRTLP